LQEKSEKKSLLNELFLLKSPADMTEEHPDTAMISGMESLLKNARICREIIRSQPNRPYEHYWKEFLKTQQMRNALLGDSGNLDRREE